MMRQFVLVNQDGFVQCSVFGPEAPHPLDGCAVYEVESPVALDGPPGHKLKWPEMEWVCERTPEQAKAEKRAEINAARFTANFTIFWFDGHEIACDALSRSDIDGTNGFVALNGTFPPGFPGAWKTRANQYVPIPDIETWKRFYSAMTAQGTANFNKSQQLKARLEDPTLASVQDIDAIPSWM